jgi:hypothetical protein
MQFSTNLKHFPFKATLSFKLLIDYWKETLGTKNAPGFMAGILDAIEKAPELREPITDPAVIEKHRGLIDFMMTAVMPTANAEQELAAAILPFQFNSFHSTAAFDRVLNFSEKVEDQVSTNIPGNQMALGKTVQACLLILNKYYNTDIKADKPMLFTIKDRVTGLDRVYKVEINHRFCEIISKKGTPAPIEKHVLKYLTEKIYDVDLWLQYFKPEDFEFHGFNILRLIDVTQEEMLSSIKYDLLQKDAVVKSESFGVIQQKLRSIFGLQDIRLGVAYFGPNNDLILNTTSAECWKSLSENKYGNPPCDDYTGSVYERSWSEKRYVTIENLEEYPYKSKVENALLRNGIKNILLAPLIDGDETIGMLELATGVPGQLNAINSTKVENVLPMFTSAVKRVKEEMSTEIQAIIQEECTTIHPSVQWRFFEAGINVMNRRRLGQKAAFEEIVFKDVYPLFGLADVRNSSTERNQAIQLDLQFNLKLAKELLNKINLLQKLPLLDEVIFKTNEQLAKIDHGLASGDESNVLEFLKNEINPLVNHFQQNPDFQKHIAKYKSHLDPVFGVVYKRRKAFEESLALINKTISTHLDEAQRSAQEMFPHYFEKYQTDGVEFTLYVGSSLVRDRKFDAFYLKNFRLWQLMLMIDVDKKIALLKPRLKNQLDITQLILAQEQPISIRFRPDEKQFDVDGAYDIRYEIVKKRIDKALIKNSSERLTQPGKIAVVYNQAKAADEYRQYFEYLASRKLIKPTVEELELEELPGANGLRALRVEVIREDVVLERQPENFLREIEQALGMN